MSAQGPKLETVLLSEVTLVPFPPGRYRIAVGGMEHPQKTVADTAFPAMLVTVLPGCRQTARLDAPEAGTAWLQRGGEQVMLTVAAPGGLLLFTTYRPHDYPTTGIRVDIERLKEDAAQQPQAPGPMARPAAAAPQARGFPKPAGFPQAPGFPQAQGMSQPQGFPQAAAFPQASAYAPPAQGFSLTPPTAGGFGAPGAAFPQAQPPMPSPGFQPQPFGIAAPGVPGGFAAPTAGFAPAAPRPFAPQSAPAAPVAPAAPTPGIRMAGHIEREGDVAFEPGQTVGVPGSRKRLEAVALYAEGVALHEIEYAAVSHDGRLMPWACPPQFTGTRGMGLPLIGFAARLSGDAAARYDIVYSGSFIQGGPAGPVANGAFLASPVQGDHLETLRVTFAPKKA
ncbi:hypothetical protein [Solidesulfovibrio sp.]|uniref:hypothetical protein n=1 Tax=Solidesulfovibrio sp. TaxID=2910990 RepID=UPI0026278B23|nr:hypothetical protein [Solidesulfovibrio sp.]